VECMLRMIVTVAACDDDRSDYWVACALCACL
jgi:hypothetical protein